MCEEFDPMESNGTWFIDIRLAVKMDRVNGSIKCCKTRLVAKSRYTQLESWTLLRYFLMLQNLLPLTVLFHFGRSF